MAHLQGGLSVDVLANIRILQLAEIALIIGMTRCGHQGTGADEDRRRPGGCLHSNAPDSAILRVGAQFRQSVESIAIKIVSQRKDLDFLDGFLVLAVVVPQLSLSRHQIEGNAHMATAGWYPDPDGKGGQRYFDGEKWGPTAPPPIPLLGAQTAAPPPPGKQTSPGGKIIMVVVVLIVILIGIGKCGGSDDTKSDSRSTSGSKSTSAVTTASPTPTGPKKPAAIFTTTPGPDGEEVTAKFAIHDNFTEGMIKDGARFDTIDILKYAKATYPNAASVNVKGTFPMKDAYGNTSTDTVIDLTYLRSTIDKINFDGVDKDKIWELRDSGIVYPAFQP